MRQKASGRRSLNADRHGTHGAQRIGQRMTGEASMTTRMAIGDCRNRSVPASLQGPLAQARGAEPERTPRKAPSAR